jgi:hypothetical protein
MMIDSAPQPQEVASGVRPRSSRAGARDPAVLLAEFRGGKAQRNFTTELFNAVAWAEQRWEHAHGDIQWW